MRVLVYANQQAHEWRDMLQALGHTVTTLPLETPPPSSDVDACVVLNQEPADLLSYRFWLANLTAPILLITTALTPAQSLCRRFPLLRLVCHPSRAARMLGDVLQMTCEVRAGAIVLGPLVDTRAERGFGGKYAIY